MNRSAFGLWKLSTPLYNSLTGENKSTGLSICSPSLPPVKQSYFDSELNIELNMPNYHKTKKDLTVLFFKTLFLGSANAFLFFLTYAFCVCVFCGCFLLYLRNIFAKISGLVSFIWVQLRSLQYSTKMEWEQWNVNQIQRYMLY